MYVISKCNVSRQLVVKWKSGREHYNDETFAMENLLVLVGMHKFVKEEATGDVAEVFLDAKAKAKLILAINPLLYVHMKEVKTSKEL